MAVGSCVHRFLADECCGSGQEVGLCGYPGLVKKSIVVVGAVIVRDNRILCAQRGAAGTLAGLWEFPGGKIEQGESPGQALQREIDEELGCEIKVGREITTTAHEYGFGIITLTTFYCELVAGTPQLTEHAEVRWVAPEELGTLEWAPADIPAVKQITAELAA